MTDTTATPPAPPPKPESAKRAALACAGMSIAAIVLLELAMRLDLFGLMDATLAAIAHAWIVSWYNFFGWLAGTSWRPIYWVTGGTALWGVCRQRMTRQPFYSLVTVVAVVAAGLATILFAAAAPGFMAIREGLATVLAGAALIALTFDELIAGVLLILVTLGFLWSYHESVQDRIAASGVLDARYGADMKRLGLVSVSYDHDDGNVTFVLAGISSTRHENVKTGCHDDLDFKQVSGHYVIWSGDLEGATATPRLEKDLDACVQPLLKLAGADRSHPPSPL